MKEKTRKKQSRRNLRRLEGSEEAPSGESDLVVSDPDFDPFFGACTDDLTAIDSDGDDCSWYNSA